MGRKSKGSHRITGIIICINNVKVRIPLDAEEKLQTKEKSILLVKHLSKEFKKIKERNMKENLNRELNARFIPISNEKTVIMQNNNNKSIFQKNVFESKTDFNIMMMNKSEKTNQNFEEKIFNYKPPELTNFHYPIIINDFTDNHSSDNQIIYYNSSSSSNNNLNQYDFSTDDEAEKVIAEWDRLWGDGNSIDDSNQLIERGFNFTNMLSAF